jgi:pimeloyl-[acyl-carrier protein] synthase
MTTSPKVEPNGQTPKPFFVDGFLENPYSTYRRVLEEGSIHFVAVGNGVQGAFSYSLVSSLMKNPRFSAKRTGAFMLSVPEEHRADFEPLVKMLGLWLLFMDPPEHSRLRKLMNKGFSPAVAEML